MADGRGEQKLKEGGDEGMRDAIPPPALYKGAVWWLGRPAQPIKKRKAQGTGTDPLPQPAAARFPASTVRHPKRMRAAWQACRTEAMDEATSPHPVIVGSGRLEDHARPHSVNGPRPHASLRLWGRREPPPLLRRDACVQSSAPRMPPTSHTPPHATPHA